MKRGLLVLLLACLGCGRHEPAQPSLDPADARMDDLLFKTCAGCHGATKPAARLRYDSLDAARQGARAAALQLAARMMPPPSVRQPSASDRKAMIAWLKAANR